ncbi:MAG: helicase, partial [Lactococcus lactis]|nr:helicase [Lactococcus lactis]
FVIDEAHNLRNQGSSRYQQILELFQENPQAKILLLTATPINNSLMDFANQIQLGSKGDLVSLNVPYISKKGSNLEYIDFFEALKRIQSEATRAEKRGEQFDWDFHRNTLVSGIRHYLVRSTRQGVIKNEQMNLSEGQTNLFPTSTIEQFPYSYLQEDDDFVYQSLLKAKNTMFENMSPTLLNLDLASELTQRTSHPLDLYRKIAEEKKSGIALSEKYGFSNKFENESIFLAVEEKLSVIPAIFKAINFLGFAPYKPDTYSYEIYNKTISEIRALNKKGNEAGKLRTQLAIHNMLHITWLKRLESSTATLKKSVKNYQERISLFEKWLNKGYIVSLTDAATLDNEYGEDIDKAFEDYEKYLSELDEAV